MFFVNYFRNLGQKEGVQQVFHYVQSFQEKAFNRSLSRLSVNLIQDYHPSVDKINVVEAFFKTKGCKEIKVL